LDRRDRKWGECVTSKGEPRLRRPTFRREERHELRYQLSIAVAELLSWVFWLTPRSLRYRIADWVGDVFCRSSNTYRENVQANVSQVLGEDTSSPDVARQVRSIFRTSSRNFADLITAPRVARDELLRSVSVTSGSWSTIDNALALGNGVVLVSAHLGCFDYIGHGLWARGYRLTIVTGRTTSRFIFDGVTHLRGSKGSVLVEPTPSGVRKVIRALRNGECAVFVADRDFFQNGRPVTFFGRETSLPPGPIRIARDVGAVVIPVLPRRVGYRHEIEIGEPFTVPKTSDIEADMDAGFARLIPVLERAIRDRLDQWVMFQRVWPETPVPPIRVFPVGSPLESELLERVAQVLPERPLTDRRTRTRGRSGATEASDGRDSLPD
jgi:KDO2-lipid IV(A) lauroyltransferase